MSDTNETRETPEAKELRDAEQNRDSSPEDSLQPPESGLRLRLRALLHRLQPRQATKADLTKDRTRSLVLLIGGTVGAILLFIGVFSTPPRATRQETAARGTPNLGRPALGDQPKPAQGSVTPLLNADVQSNDGASDQLSAADIRGTSRRSSEADEDDTDGQATSTNVGVRQPGRQTAGAEPGNPISSDRSDALAPYQVNPGTGSPTYSYGGASASAAEAELPRTFSYGGLTSATAGNSPNSASSAKSSIVFRACVALHQRAGKYSTSFCDPPSAKPPCFRRAHV